MKVSGTEERTGHHAAQDNDRRQATTEPEAARRQQPRDTDAEQHHRDDQERARQRRPLGQLLAGELEEPGTRGGEPGARQPAAAPVLRSRALGRSVEAAQVRADGSPAPTSSGSTPKNTQRHDAWSASSPAMGGPTSDGRTQPLEIAEKTRGRSSAGKARPTTT